MIQRDRKRQSLTVGQAAWRIGTTPTDYRELEAGERAPSSDEYERMVEVFELPLAFVSRR